MHSGYLKISAKLGEWGARATTDAAVISGVSSSYVRYLRSVTGHLLNRQREREQEESGGRRRKEAREKGEGERRGRGSPGQSVEDSAGERGRRDGWTVRGKMVREKRKRRKRGRTKKSTKRGKRNGEGDRCERGSGVITGGRTGMGRRRWDNEG